ncbi:MAG: 6-carboxytetrahydropterin synthase [Thermoguttaceae bacterium]|jgi:6-pyruvoyltetrahydropterin/6-carboxytetrahydropterin synthase
MFRVSRQLEFCYGHRLLDYEGKCRHLHGHNGTVQITLQAARLDRRSMVLDFGDIKTALARWIDENLDHRMILCRRDPAVSVLQGLGEPLYLMDENPTAENIAKLLFDMAVAQGFPVVEVRFWETPRCSADYAP